jgi:RimJ/RimL family protein N-acetyltransferase
MTNLTFPALFAGALVRLAAPLPADKEVFARWSRDDAYLRNLDDDPARPAAEGNFTSFDTPAAPPDSFYFHVRTLEDDCLIGFVVLHSVKWSNQSALLTIGIGDPAYRGRGYGQDALRLILNYAFNELNLYRVGLTVMAYNAVAIKAYERAGFVREGATRGAVQRDGARHDLLHFGILRDEWLAHRP